MTLQEEELKNVCNMSLPHRILYATNVNREDGGNTPHFNL